MKNLILCLVLISVATSSYAAESRNPYAKEKEVPIPLPISDLSRNEIKVPNISPITPPVTRATFDFVKKMSLIGVRGDSVLVKETDGVRYTLHALKIGGQFQYDGVEFFVKYEAGLAPKVLLLQNSLVAATISAQEMAVQDSPGAPK